MGGDHKLTIRHFPSCKLQFRFTCTTDMLSEHIGIYHSSHVALPHKSQLAGINHMVAPFAYKYPMSCSDDRFISHLIMTGSIKKYFLSLVDQLWSQYLYMSRLSLAAPFMVCACSRLVLILLCLSAGWFHRYSSNLHAWHWAIIRLSSCQ